MTRFRRLDAREKALDEREAALDARAMALQAYEHELLTVAEQLAMQVNRAIVYTLVPIGRES